MSALIDKKDRLILRIPIIYKLNEVIITPYGLSGVLASDMTHHIDKNIIIASKLGLPNTDVPVMSYVNIWCPTQLFRDLNIQ